MKKEFKQKFGVELEFEEATPLDVAHSLHKYKDKLGHPISCIEYSIQEYYKEPRVKDDTKCWHLVDDASVSDTDDEGNIHGGEVISPLFSTTPESFKKLRWCVKALNRAKATYSQKTGYHVHVDTPNIDRMILLTIWGMLSSDIYQLFHKRISNDYARILYKFGNKTRNTDMLTIIQLILLSNDVCELIDDKYSVLHMYEKDTCNNNTSICEFRVAQMEENPHFISAWTKTCCQIVNEASQYRDLLDLIENASSSLSLFCLNNKSPCNIKWTRLEEQAINEEVCIYL